MSVPTPEVAEQLLGWAERLNPGPWVSHVRTAARAARTIAAACGMDPDRAYVLGLLHDIGRYQGVTSLQHVVAGYQLMMEKGYTKVALICQTHTFPVPTLEGYHGAIDCTPEEAAQLEAALHSAVYDDEVLLIQLCDAICLPDRVTLVEQRLVEVALRHGVTPQIPEKWRAFLNLKTHFDGLCGRNIYTLFPEDMRKLLE